MHPLDLGAGRADQPGGGAQAVMTFTEHGGADRHVLPHHGLRREAAALDDGLHLRDGDATGEGHGTGSGDGHRTIGGHGDVLRLLHV